MELDPNTPFSSPAEMTQARSTKDYLGRNKYENDEAFRAAWDAKMELGYQHGSGPTVRIKGPNQVIMGAADEASVREFRELTAQRDHLVVEVEKQEERELVAHIQGNPDAKKPEVTPFANSGEMTRAMGNPLYRAYGAAGDAYRAHVGARVEASDPAALGVSVNANRKR